MLGGVKLKIQPTTGVWRKCSVRRAILELVDILEVKRINKLKVINPYLNESLLFNLSYGITLMICVRDGESRRQLSIRFFMPEASMRQGSSGLVV